MVKIAHISDTHLGYTRYSRLCPETNRNQREVDAQEAYRRAVDEILEREVDLVIHSGDVFDTIRPATHVIMGFLKQTSRILGAGIPYVGIAGNHETPRLRTTTAALGYANLFGAYFVHGYDWERTTERIGDTSVSVALVPHGAVLDSAPSVTPDPGAEINILVTHGTVPGLRVHGHEIGEVDLPENVLSTGFDYVALGHFHEYHRHSENAYYAGATEHFSFAEADSETGFVILDFSEGKVTPEHVPVQSRPMIDLPRIDAAGLDGPDLNRRVEQLSRREDLEGAIVRLKVANAAAGVSGEVDRELLRELKARCLNFSLEITTAGGNGATGENGLEVPTANFGSLEEEFRNFVAGRREAGELDEKFAAEFTERGVGYLRDAAQQDRIPEGAR